MIEVMIHIELVFSVRHLMILTGSSDYFLPKNNWSVAAAMM
jgi:hypothetical protein